MVHRRATPWRAAQMLKIKKLPAIVFEGLTPELEAALRLELNHRKAETVGERFKAKVIAKDPKALSLLEIARTVDMKIGIDRQLGDSVNAISALETVWEIDKGVTLKTILKLIKDARGELNSETAWRSNIFMLKWFVGEPRQRDGPQAPALRDAYECDGDRRQGRHAARPPRRVTVGQPYRVLVELYNEEMPKAQQLELKLKGHG